MNGDTEFVGTPAALAALTGALEELEDGAGVALDTEFTRVTTYYPRFDLLQLSFRGRTFIVDVPALDALPLFARLAGGRFRLLLFSCREDIEVIAGYCGRRGLRPPFPPGAADAQLLAAFLNISYSAGLAASLRSALAVELEKSQTRSDWSRRPLSAAQLSYAADDVRYLEALCRSYLGSVRPDDRRLAWFARAMQDLTEECLRDRDPAQCYRFIDGAGLLQPRELARLRHLARRREEFCRAGDIAPGRVAGPRALLLMAQKSPLTRHALLECGVKWPAVRAYQDRLVHWVRESLELEEAEPPAPPLDAPARTPEGAAEAARLKRYLEGRAAAAGIRPELIARRGLIRDYLCARSRGERALLQSSWLREASGL